MMDWRTLGLENFGVFPPANCTGKYNIPVIMPTYELPRLEWTGFNHARRSCSQNGKGVHFFLDDYQFNSVWSRPSRYLDMLGRFGAVMSPDFSLYRDMPMALQIYNHYRKHWCAQYWQYNGITVIPTISWSTPESWDWCFDGEPTESIVAVSTVGVKRDKYSAELFHEGYFEMVDRLKPTQVICYGERLSYMRGNVLEIEPFLSELRKRKSVP